MIAPSRAQLWLVVPGWIDNISIHRMLLVSDNVVIRVKKLLIIFDRGEKLRLLGLLGLMVIGAALEVIGIGIVTAFIGVITNPNLIAEHRVLRWLYELLGAASVRDFAIYTGAALFAVFVVKNTYLAFLVYAQTRFALYKEAMLSKRLLAAYLSNPYTFHLQRNSAELLKNITVEVGHVITGIVMPAMALVTETVVLVFILALLAAVEPVVAISIFLILGLTSFLFVRLVKPVLSRSGRQRSISAGLRIKWVHQALGSIKEVKLMGKESFFINAFFDSSLTYSRAGLIATTLQHLPRLIVETLAMTSILIVIVVMQSQGRNLQNMLPVLTLFALAAMRIMPSINRITPAFNQIRYWFPAIEAVHRDLQFSLDQHVPEARPPERLPAESKQPAFTSEIALRDVAYRYPGNAEWAVQHVSLSIPRGSSIAFMGASGAGKSTLIELILSLMEPMQGAILIDGQPLAGIRTVWQRRIGYVPQAIYLMDDTVRRNVAFGVIDERIDDGRVWAALRTARLEGMVNALAKGLDTLVGERGVRLSGGERQRIGIARALYNDPEVLVLDEATSALDGETERAFGETVAELMRTKTVLIVAHRVTTVKRCDVIFFIRGGELADSGTCDDLMARNEDFRKMIGQSAGDQVSQPVTAAA